MAHLNNDCSSVRKFSAKVNKAAEQWKGYLEGRKLEPYSDIRSFFSSCNEFLTVIASKVENLTIMKGGVKKDKIGNDCVDE